MSLRWRLWKYSLINVTFSFKIFFLITLPLYRYYVTIYFVVKNFYIINSKKTITSFILGEGKLIRLTFIWFSYFQSLNRFGTFMWLTPTCHHFCKRDKDIEEERRPDRMKRGDDVGRKKVEDDMYSLLQPKRR